MDNIEIIIKRYFRTEKRVDRFKLLLNLHRLSAIDNADAIVNSMYGRCRKLLDKIVGVFKNKRQDNERTLNEIVDSLDELDEDLNSFEDEVIYRIISYPLSEENSSSDEDDDGYQKASEGEGNGNNGRFWEYYAVRYFGGTFIAAICLVGLYELGNNGVGQIWTFFENLSSSTKIGDSSAAILTLFFGLAFTYSYIASAPIYVLHLFRVTLIDDESKRIDIDNIRYIYFKKRVAAAFITALFVIIIIICAYTFKFYYFFEYLNEKYLAVSGFVVILILQLSALFKYFRQKTQFPVRLFKFYKNLSSFRSQSNPNFHVIKEYKESYRVLREHGNAFMLIIANVLFTCILSIAPSAQAAAGIVVLWVAPATVGWFAASMLESQLVDGNV